MAKKYAPLATHTIEACQFSRPKDNGGHLFVEDPALLGMIDFKLSHPLTINQDKRMYDARMEMLASELHLIFVLDDSNQLVGFLSLEEILSEAPIKMIQSERIASRKTIPVSRLMTPLVKAAMITMDTLEYARIGNIIKTLQEIDTPYLLVMETSDSGEQYVCGAFIAQHLSERLGYDIRLNEQRAQTIAQLNNEIYS